MCVCVCVCVCVYMCVYVCMRVYVYTTANGMFREEMFATIIVKSEIHSFVSLLLKILGIHPNMCHLPTLHVNNVCSLTPKNREG